MEISACFGAFCLLSKTDPETNPCETQNSLDEFSHCDLPVVGGALCCLIARITTQSFTEAEPDLTLNFSLNTGIFF